MDVESTLLNVTKNLEKQVDAAIDKIDNLDVNDLEELRKRRMKELKEKDAKRREWLLNGHGKYEELAEEKMFFDVIKKSDKVVLHFYTNTNERSRIVDKHFKILAPKHIETLFAKLNAEKCPFLVEKLKIKVIPSIVCVKNGIMVDKLVGFTTLGNCDDFTTETMEWRLAQNEILDYEGDLSIPPSEAGNKGQKTRSNGKIRDGLFNGEDDDLFIDDDYNKDEGESSTKNGSSNPYELTPEEEAELGLND